MASDIRCEAPYRPSRLYAADSNGSIPIGWFLIVAFLFGIVSQSAWAYTPESPEVRAMVDKAKKYLTEKEDKHAGGKALVALVFLKDSDGAHPLVKEAEAEVIKHCDRSAEDMAMDQYLYENCLCAIFLCELDAEKYRPVIERLLKSFWLAQKPHGGFGYSNRGTGDTSMTQYVVLAAWTAFHHKIDVDWNRIENCLEWLLRTQDLEGGWGYQGRDPGQLGADRRMKQDEVRLSLGAGGLGSVYIVADMMGVGDKLKKVSKEESQLPAAFQLWVDPAEKKKRQKRRGMSAHLLPHVRRSMDDGNGYFADNFQVPMPSGFDYNCYYLYGLERYKSFYEQVDQTKDKSGWYDAGVEYLQEKQRADGGFPGLHAPSDTAFAALFMLRSTKKSIQASLGQGLLTGGKGLPKDTSKIRLRRGKLVAEPLTASPDEIMSIMEDPENPKFAALADNPESVLLSSDPGKRQGELQRLRRLAQTGDTEARRLAVQALGKHRDFDNVPVLVFALGDNDAKVVHAARDALRFVSRKFAGFKLPNYPSNEQKLAAILKWKEWYRSVRPDATFLE